jgi:hypothetical protein
MAAEGRLWHAPALTTCPARRSCDSPCALRPCKRACFPVSSSLCGTLGSSSETAVLTAGQPRWEERSRAAALRLELGSGASDRLPAEVLGVYGSYQLGDAPGNSYASRCSQMPRPRRRQTRPAPQKTRLVTLEAAAETSELELKTHLTCRNPSHGVQARAVQGLRSWPFWPNSTNHGPPGELWLRPENASYWSAEQRRTPCCLTCDTSNQAGTGADVFGQCCIKNEV